MALESAKYWAALDNPQISYVSPISEDQDPASFQQRLLDRPAKDIFAGSEASIGRSHCPSQLVHYMRYVDLVLTIWVQEYGGMDSPDMQEWNTYKNQHPEWWGDEKQGAYVPIASSGKVRLLPTQKAKEDMERKTRFRQGLVQRILFALLIPHPEEWLEESPLSVRMLPSEWVIKAVLGKIDPLKPSWEEVCFHPVSPLRSLMGNRCYAGSTSYIRGVMPLLRPGELGIGARALWKY